VRAVDRARDYAGWLRRRIQDLPTVFQALHASDAGVHVALPRLFRLTLREEYSATEILMLGLIGQTPLVSEATFISKKSLMRRQLQINPRACIPYTENKLVFFRRCADHGLSTPRVLAAVGPRAGDSAGVPVAETPTDLVTQLGPVAPYDFVFKPTTGVYGRGILALRFDGTTFVGPAGRSHSAEDLFAHVARSEYRRWLLQDRIYPHRDLVALAGTNYLQTARVISYLDARNRPQIPIAWLRIIGADSVVDNFKFGMSGNLVGTIDLATGRLEHVLGPKQPGPGLRVWSHHPGTSVAFDDFRVPFMDEVRDLVSRAALAFAPLRTIGWDVAISDTGPSLIEGNVTWDPLPTRRDLRTVVASLQ
jgi:Sugar-transfer associated ATP-grasp